MSENRSQKNIDRPNEFYSRALCSLNLKPVVISDSKGRYLQECVNGKTPENKILWVFKSGATTFDRYLWLCQNIDNLIQEYGNLSVYIFTGTCDLTIRQRIKVGFGKNQRLVKSKYATLRTPDSVDLLQRHYLMLKRLLETKGVKLTFLNVPLYSIERLDDKRLTEYVEAVNMFINKIDKDMGTYSPKLNEDL